MQKAILSLACTLGLTAPSLAGAQGLYVGAQLGLAMPVDSDWKTAGITLETSADSGLAVGAVIGHAFPNNLRIEGELAYQKNDLDTVSWRGLSTNLNGDVSSLALLANGYYDFRNHTPLTPYVSAGLGVARVEADVVARPGAGLPGGSDEGTVFAYQIGAGVAYAVSNQVAVDLKYRYFGTEHPSLGGVEIDYASHILYAGFRVSF
ncbi:MAG: porin family protein [Sphingobacteriia bacterium]|nr:porin family protein [Sphingobacteriia bacterium]NCC37962.1 porin family protein [Gammaproteobacteria bacterium]